MKKCGRRGMGEWIDGDGGGGCGLGGFWGGGVLDGLG